MTTDAPPTAADQDQDRSGEDAARIEGRRALDTVIVAMARAAGATVQQRPVAPGLAGTMACAEPAAGVRFAWMLRDTAERKVREYITRARQDGLSWQQIGHALGLAELARRNGTSLAEAAFEYAAGAEHADRFARLVFAWRCPACLEVVIDRGPYDGHPEDYEPGHADGCGRLAAAIAAWQAGLPAARP